jgi:hypothetical protein
MVAVQTKPRIVQEPVEDTIRRLETFVARMERRYECSSDCMSDAIAQGKARETAEVARWLIASRTLQRLRAAVGREIGTATSNTK